MNKKTVGRLLLSSVDSSCKFLRLRALALLSVHEAYYVGSWFRYGIKLSFFKDVSCRYRRNLNFKPNTMMTTKMLMVIIVFGVTIFHEQYVVDLQNKAVD